MYCRWFQPTGFAAIATVILNAVKDLSTCAYRFFAPLRMTNALALFAFLTFIFQLSSFNSFAQPKPSRILFILDASGSMNSKWKDQNKFDLAKEILFNVADSLNRTNKTVELGLRVIGHQSPRSENNCKDSKLEVQFARNNAQQFKAALNAIVPKGQTPIAYSLLQAVNDFPKDTLAIHSIVLITDGIETCSGDACAAAKDLSAKRIAVKPFIVGLGISAANMKFYDCVGTLVNVMEENEFTNVMSAVVKQALNRTTLQVNLLNKEGMPSETDVPFTLYDRSTKASRYHFVHKLDARGNPDTLVIDARSVYDIVVHSIPAVTVENIQLTPGKHNAIAVDLPRGVLKLDIEGQKTTAQQQPISVQCLVRPNGSPNILYVQDFNTSKQFLEGTYDLEILTLPRIVKDDVNVSPTNPLVITVPKSGTLQLNPTEIGVATLLIDDGEKMQKVFDFYSISTPQTLQLQPGVYTLAWRPDKGRSTAKTKAVRFEIASTKTTTLKP